MDTVNRIKLYNQALGERQISLSYFASDAAPNQFSAMKFLVKFGECYIENGFEFAYNPHTSYKCIQDTIHLINRLKNRLMNKNCHLWIGSKIASMNQIKILVDDPLLSRLDHGLILSDVNCNDESRDKMSFHSTLRIMDIKVEVCLHSIEGSQGTRMYLKLMRYIHDSFLKTDESPRERLYKAIYALTFLRVWKNFIETHMLPAECFVTKSCWESLELNVGFLYKLVVEKRANKILISDSQKCENLFRQVRSITDSGLTEINFSCSTFFNKINQVQSIEMIGNELRKNGVWIQKKYDTLVDDNDSSDSENEDIEMESYDFLIEETIHDAVNEAKCDAIFYDMLPTEINLQNHFKCPNLKENLSQEQREYSEKYFKLYGVEIESVNIDGIAIEDDHVKFKNLYILNCAIGKLTFLNDFLSDVF